MEVPSGTEGTVAARMGGSEGRTTGRSGLVQDRREMDADDGGLQLMVCLLTR